MTARSATLLRIYVNSSERWKGRPVYEAVVASARTAGIAGASVFPVEFSYGEHARVHDATSEYQFADTPVVIEIVDEGDRIESLLEELGAMVSGSLVTLESVRIPSPNRP
jgi:PII-like signaling protein